MIFFSNITRNLKVVITGLALLATTTFQVKGQFGQSEVYQPIPHSWASSALGEKGETIEWEKGMEAYRNGKMDEAIRYFKKALVPINNNGPNGMPLDPNEYIYGVNNLIVADMLARKVTPGVETPENLRIAQYAISLYREMTPPPGLVIHYPKPFVRSIVLNAMTQIARINFSINRFEESKAWRKRVLDEEPKDAEAGFAVGVIDWIQARQNALTALKAAGLTDDGLGNAKAPVAAMETIKAQNGFLVEEGLKYLNQALENRPDNAETMAYLDRIYRRKADLDYAYETARLDDVAKASEWAHKASETRKANDAKKPAGAAAAKP
jgi:tetratricopeptide (TPR) repeat protein